MPGEFEKQVKTLKCCRFWWRRRRLAAALMWRGVIAVKKRACAVAHPLPWLEVVQHGQNSFYGSRNLPNT